MDRQLHGAQRVGEPSEHGSAEELACQARAGSSAAFGLLAERYSPALRRYLRRRCTAEQDADDLCQDTLVRAMENLGRYDASRPFGAWLFTIAARLAATRARTRRVPAAMEVDDVPATGDGPAELAAQRESGGKLWETAKAVLPPRQYEALHLRYARSLAVEHIAAEMRLTQTHVKVLLYRARRKLQKAR